MNQDILSIKIGGAAGQGIKSAGLMFAKVASRSGFNIFDYTEYPSLIRGGHNMMQIIISKEEVATPIKKVDLLVALNKETLEKYLNDLDEGTGIIFDETINTDSLNFKENVNKFPIPLSKLAEEAGNKELFLNTVALGSLTALVGANIEILKGLINEEFEKKGEEVVNKNYQAVESGYNFAKEHFGDKILNFLVKTDDVSSKIIVNGNDTIAMGAIAAGLQFVSVYPMTPITNMLHILAANQEKFGYIYKQPEDEIAAINMAIGASFAGARSMTASSGGGFCLMTEGYGLAGQTETPLVIIYGMRPGPATGLPTWNEQGDLNFILHAHQGEFPKIILSAGDPKEAFELTMQAFNLADKYQTPVVVIVDKDICENDQTFSQFDFSEYEISRGKFSPEAQTDYLRYKIEEDGVSKRAIPGNGTYLISNSDEHSEAGYSNEEAENRKQQMEKRMRKLTTCANENMQEPKLYGPEEADLTIISWGSNKGGILHAMKNFENVNFLYINWISPFPSEKVKEILNKSKRLLDIESNYSGQMADLIRQKTGIEISEKLLSYDGRPIYPETIVEKIKNLL
jgi:2-oxoglutarate/2-oxoacid ferredoxin oxidoreductase subunit alpha